MAKLPLSFTVCPMPKAPLLVPVTELSAPIATLLVPPALMVAPLPIATEESPAAVLITGRSR